MVHFVCPLGEATVPRYLVKNQCGYRCEDIVGWSSHLNQSPLRKADHSPKCGWASSNQWTALRDNGQFCPGREHPAPWLHLDCSYDHPSLGPQPARCAAWPILDLPASRYMSQFLKTNLPLSLLYIPGQEESSHQDLNQLAPWTGTVQPPEPWEIFLLFKPPRL